MFVNYLCPSSMKHETFSDIIQNHGIIYVVYYKGG